MTKDKAVILCSGGLNSAVVTSIATKEYQSIALLHVRLGDRAAQKETELFEQQAEHFGVRELLAVDMPHFAAIGGNARVSRKRQIEDALAIGDTVPNCYIPGLIGSLISAAFSWAWTIGAEKILLGVSENLGPPAPKTSVIYPDYSQEFIQLCNHLSSESSSGRRINVEAPVIDLSRTEIVKLGRRLNTPFELTWSCISSGTEPCGACVGCATRIRGFLDAAIPDPIMLDAARGAVLSAM
jgi:7-cyano-7-deazaguanine synthase